MEHKQLAVDTLGELLEDISSYVPPAGEDQQEQDLVTFIQELMESIKERSQKLLNVLGGEDDEISNLG